MDLSVFNKYQEYQSETEKQFTPALRTSNHEDPDIHLIGESVPAPSLLSSVTGTPAIGSSPIPAREDHTHGLDASAIPFSLSATGVSSTVSAAGSADTVSRGDHAHALPEPLTRARFGITANGSALAPAIYWTSDAFLGIYRTAGGNMIFTDGGIAKLELGIEVSTTLNYRTFAGFYVDGGANLIGHALGSCESINSNGMDLDITTAGSYTVFNNWIQMVGPPVGVHFPVTWNVLDNIVYVDTSKREYKDDIKSIEEQFSSIIIDRLNPVSFVYSRKKEYTQESEAWRKADIKYGFIAEEVAEVHDKLALWDYPRDEEGNRIDEQQLVPASYSGPGILAIAIAELKSLRKRVAELEDKLHGKIPLDA